METASVVLSLAGAALALLAALWLLFLNPDDERFTDDGLLYPGRQVSRVVPALLKAQRRAGAVVVVGAVCQLLGILLTVLAK